MSEEPSTHGVRRSAPPAAPTGTLLSLKTQQKAKEEEEKIRLKRRRGVLVLCMQFLNESGYYRSLDALQQESNVSLSKFAPADNVDLVSIVHEFEDYYEFKFGRRPKLFRQLEDGSGAPTTLDFAPDGERMLVRPTNPQGQPSKGPTRVASHRKPASANDGKAVPPKSMDPPPPPEKAEHAIGQNFAKGAEPISGKAINMRGRGATPPEPEFEVPTFQGRSGIKPLPTFETAELNELAQNIHRDILDVDPSVQWNSIAELGDVKQLLKEAVVMPVKYPQLFSGIVRPWGGILLFGPPGTGKTMLAKAVATECKTTFFNISASTIVSKWRGDSEKLVRLLFELAVYYAPSTIFIDELDSLMSARSSDGTEHEGSRRMKTELLIQMEGLSKRKNGALVFVLAASNMPWDLDSAILRRLEKRINVGLPTFLARRIIFEKNLQQVSDDFDFELVCEKTAGYSGADIEVVCREAVMRTVRVLIEKLESNSQELGNTPLSKPSITTADVLESIRCTKSSCMMIDPRKYTEWEKQFGSTISK